MLDTHTYEVDGITYRHTVLDAKRGRRLYYRLVQSLAPTLNSLDISKTDSPVLFLSRFIMSALAGLGPELFDDLCDACAETTFVLKSNGEDNLAKVFGMHFAGRYSSLMKWLVETVRLNGWLDFLEESFKAGLQSLAADIAKASEPESPKA
jgi:hypothetical protein